MNFTTLFRYLIAEIKIQHILSFRLTPSLMFVILFSVKLKPFLAYSPIWTLQKDKFCPKYWWTNLLYINNFYPTSFVSQVILL